MGNPGFKEAWQDPWCTNWASSHSRGGCFHLLAPGCLDSCPYHLLWTTHPEEGFLPSTLGLETQGRPIAPVVLAGESNAIPRPENRGAGCPATWGLSGCGPLQLGSLDEDHCPIPAPGVWSGWREEGCHPFGPVFCT